jgi:deferrochelatase/peroxidase EfeB
MNAPSESMSVDFSDIQGLVRFAHGRLNEAAFVLLRVKDAILARHWLADAPISSAKAISPLPPSALQIAFTASGLRALGLDEAILAEFSTEFSSGICGDENRSRRLGDTANNKPQGWQWGGIRAEEPHVLLMVYSGEGELKSTLNKLHQSEFKAAFDKLYTLKSKTSGPEEPFGFVDGISQPLIDWQQSVSTDPHKRDRYGNLLALGEVLLGYPNEYGLCTGRPLLKNAATGSSRALPTALDAPGCRDLGRNGTYLVLRQLAQDVSGFWQFLDRHAGADLQQREQLAAAMVGRQRDGSPLMARTGSDIAGVAPHSSDNHFNYDSDPLGRRCPIGSHIRRANPRTGDVPPGVTGPTSRLLRTLGFIRRHPADDLVASTRFHRILRRGRVYGSSLKPEQALRVPPLKKAAEERGLYFICLGANIARQFEFVQNAWCMSSKFAGLPTEADPLIGNREPLTSGSATDSFSQPQAGAPALRTEALPQFVSVRGGAYFFMPGLRALNYIVHQGQ